MNYKEKLKEIEKEKKKLQEKALEIFEEECQSLFEKHEGLESFGWTQYTPHFNDGDPCTFSVNSYDESISINGECVDDIGEYHYKEKGFEDGYDLSKSNIKNANKLLSKIVKLLGTVNDDVLQQYGEGQIVVSNNGNVSVEYYEHD